MNCIPESYSAYKRSAVFTESSVPKGLLKDHSVAEHCYAKIIVLEGEIEYTLSGESSSSTTLTPENPGTIKPLVKHYINPLGKTRFYVEFYREERI